MTCLFPAQLGLGGLFPIAAAFCGLIYLISKKRFIEISNKDVIFRFLIYIFFLSSLLGWLFLNESPIRDIIVGILSFSGIVSLLYISGHIRLTPTRIIQFVNLNIFLAVYALIASLNTMFKILPKMVALPQWAGDWIDTERLFDAGAGGITGLSPLNGQHNLLLAILFATFYFYSFLSKHFPISRNVLLFGLIIAVINVFTSASKAVFTSLLISLILAILLQGKLSKTAAFGKRIYLVISFAIISTAVYFFVSAIGFDYVFQRFDKQLDINESQGVAFSVENVLNGRAINRGSAYEEGFKRYKSRDSWLIGYGWSTIRNNRVAFFVDSDLNRSSAHNQYFAILFLFGWLGFIPFWSLHIAGITKSYKLLSRTQGFIENKVFALSSFIMLIALITHGFTVDNLFFPGYFASTLIIIGLAYSNINTAKSLKFI